MRMKLEHRDCGVHVKLSGDFNYEATQDAQVRRADGPYAGNVVIDLSEVEFIDSSGLNALVAIGQHHEGPVRLVGLTPQAPPAIPLDRPRRALRDRLTTPHETNCYFSAGTVSSGARGNPDPAKT